MSQAAERAAELEREGFVVLPGVIPAPQTAALRECVGEALETFKVPFGSNEFLGIRTRRLFNLLSRGEAFTELPLHEQVLPIVESLLGPDCLLSSLTAIEMGPGETDQPLHCDDGTLPLPRPHAPYTCTAIWALTEFSDENGATRFVPGSHRADRSPRRGEDARTETAVMPEGSVLLYHGSLWHGGGANRSAERRMGIVVNYCAGFLRQEECQLLALSRERVATFPARLQALVGYGTYRGLLGHVDQQNPATLIDPDAETDMVWRRIQS